MREQRKFFFNYKISLHSKLELVGASYIHQINYLKDKLIILKARVHAHVT